MTDEKKYKEEVPKPLSLAKAPVVTNLVFTADLKRRLNVKRLAEGLGGCYDPYRFPAWQIRNRNPWAMLSVHINGVVVVVGAKSSKIAIQAVYIQLYRMFTTFGEYAEVHNFGLQNVVAPFHIGFKVNLNLILDDYRDRSEMDQQDIGALRVYPRGMNISPVLVIWASGKAHIAGRTKTKRTIQAVYEYIAFEMYQSGKEYRGMSKADKAKRITKPVLQLD